MKIYKGYFEQILTGLMHILIGHSNLLRCHTWDLSYLQNITLTNFIIGLLYPCKQYNEDIMNLIAVILTQYWFFHEIKNEKDKPVCVEKDYILPNVKLQFSHNNIFPRVSVCQNSDEIKATGPHNVKDVFFVSFYIYLQMEINHRKHHHATTLDFTNLLVKLWNLCSWKILKSKMTLFCSWYLI